MCINSWRFRQVDVRNTFLGRYKTVLPPFTETPLAIYLLTWSWSSSFLWWKSIFFVLARALTRINKNSTKPISHSPPGYFTNISLAPSAIPLTPPPAHMPTWRRGTTSLDVIIPNKGNEDILYPVIIPWTSTTFVSKVLFLLFWPEFFRELSSLQSCTMVTNCLFYCLMKVNLVKLRFMKNLHHVCAQSQVGEPLERRMEEGWWEGRIILNMELCF